MRPWLAAPVDLALPVAPVVAFVGNYGSGKTEVAVGYALELARGSFRVNIADLDIVNPYFRCREAIGPLEERGVRVVAPRGVGFHSELPILLPEVRGLLGRKDEVSILDVGGDDSGARALSHLAPDFPPPGEHKLLQVVNQRRPFTDTVRGCLRMRDEIEQASRLQVTGLVANTHLMDETTADIVAEGYAFAAEVARAAGVPIEMVVVSSRVAALVDRRSFSAPVLVIDRQMLPPWADAGVDGGGRLGWAGERERLRLLRG
ncbi:MAG: cobalamin biosynthesis protein CbiA [Deltaproteobacteria bacterium]|nr:cobalamin biosynthesis protein CbiA [Deltaproteobacteria bacterium]